MDTSCLTKWERVQLELVQAQEEGKAVGDYGDKVKAIENEPYILREEHAGQLLDEIIALPVEKDFMYVEPNVLDEIRETRPRGARRFNEGISEGALFDKIYGAWLGRIAGNWLGQPLEGYSMAKGKDSIKMFLQELGEWPLSGYLDFQWSDEFYERYGINKNLKHYSYQTGHSPEDDDINYTVLCLDIYKKYGQNFSSEDVAEGWLKNLPIFHTYTAERVAYSNLTQLIMPPQSAIYRNPYREWIGAQIRADFWGYINPGDMERAAEYAYRDASVSHVKNGVYGEMFIAAMLAAAFVLDDPRKVLEAGLSAIPDKCRLAYAIRDVLEWSRTEPDWERCLDRIYEKYGHYNVVHTINNACIVALALLYGGMDFGKSICIAVMGGLDTDCNGATVGSIIGLMLGAKQLPEYWIKPICDTAVTGVSGYYMVRVSDLAKETLELINRG